jgi:hypothetical protein
MDELVVLDEVVCLHLPITLQVEVWSIGIFYTLLLFLLLRWLCFFIFMYWASFRLGVVLAWAFVGATWAHSRDLLECTREPSPEPAHGEQDNNKTCKWVMLVKNKLNNPRD